MSKHIICHSVHVSLQTSLSFLRSQPPWRFRSFATISSRSPFLPFPTTIKKTLAASLTFNLPSWRMKYTRTNATVCYKTYSLNYKRETGGRKQRQSFFSDSIVHPNRTTRVWHTRQKWRHGVAERSTSPRMYKEFLKRGVAGSYSHLQIRFNPAAEAGSVSSSVRTSDSRAGEFSVHGV